LSLIHYFKKAGQEIKADISMGLSRYQRTSQLISDVFNADNVVIQDNIIQKIPVKGHNENITISTDFKTPLNEQTKLDLGVKYINFNFASQNFPTVLYPGQSNPIDEIALKNHFDFSQMTYAIYSNVNRKISEKWNAQLGLRAEKFEYDGYVFQYSKDVTGNFLNLFPSAFISYKHKENHDYTLNYTRRTNRPNFFQLIPFIDVSNPQDTSIGNPELRPEFINAVELGYNTMFKNKHSFFVSVYYQYNENLISRYRRFNPNGTTFTQTRNLTSGTTYGLEGNLKYIFSKKWDATMNVNLFYNHINTSNIDANLINNGISGFGKMITNYKWNKYDIQLSGNYNGRAPIVQGYMKAYGNVDLAVKRSFIKNLLTITLTGNDVFNTTKQVSVYDLNNVYNQITYRKPLSRQVGIAAQFRFLSKNVNPADVKDRRINRKGKDEKEVKSRDENLKKDERDEDNNSGGNNNTPR
jgi:outer membrane receptor protein involved in Fe transport